MNINYNEDFRFLNNSMLKNELVVFVGAGASVGSGYPSWNDLINIIQDKLGIIERTENDYTIIPQLYYNSRGRKDYNELVKSLFDMPNAKTNDIHDALVKINPRYIITTNYDNLIEQAFSDNGVFLDVIEKDSDLPYAHSEQLLIKMHGGFKYDNYVLKEDDYLNYSRNFTLIESYIKALFARYTILFVGYSFKDPNTKQLFSWVRSILKEDQQRAYIINVENEYDLQSYDYYKNMGINVLFAKSIVDKSNGFTQDAVCILNEIIAPKTHTLSKINSIFKGYDVFNYISREYIQFVFNQFFMCRCFINDDILIFICNNDEEFFEASQYFDDLNSESIKSIQAEYPYINKILRKSSINEIRFIKNYGKNVNEIFGRYKISDHVKQFDFTQFEEFDYTSVKKGIIPYLENNEENGLQKAYRYYYLNNYTNTYNLLSKAAKEYISTRQLELYLIAENNRIVVGDTLSNNPLLFIEESQRKRIKQEMKSIKSYGLYANSISITKKNKPVSELIDFKYIYKMLYQIVDYCKKVDKEARTYYYSFCGTKAYDKIEFTINELYKYMQYNYLFLDAFSETRCVYTMFIDSILLSLSTKETINDDGLFGSTSNISLEKLSRFDIMVMLRFLTYDEIKNLTAKYNIDRIELNDEARAYISKVITNLNQSFSNDMIPQQNIIIFAKLFHILKMVVLSEEQFELVFSSFVLVLEQNNDSRIIKEANSFICKQHHDNHNTFKAKELRQLIISICTRIEHSNDTNRNSDNIKLLKNISAILSETHPKIKIADKNIISSLSEYALVPLYTVSNSLIQKQIQRRLYKSLGKTKDLYLYTISVMHNIIQPDRNIENMLYQYTFNSNGEGEYTRYCANLYINDMFIEKERFIDLINRDSSLSLVVNPDAFDYDKFDPDILLRLTKTALQRIRSNEKAYNCIHEKLKRYLSNNWSDKLAKIYIDYFS